MGSQTQSIAHQGLILFTYGLQPLPHLITKRNRSIAHHRSPPPSTGSPLVALAPARHQKIKLLAVPTSQRVTVRETDQSSETVVAPPRNFFDDVLRSNTAVLLTSGRYCL
ncbi:unnamed protein product [Arabis nemorensis]|uniref:Uncharacterized protein n=1 Tax=Arabis nemorensis TaxID=586526 RepID=A0A565CEE5_9BRAS|nr:unnamed protein product [Arabis nemorensis]